MEPMKDIVIGWENGDELACIDAPSNSRWKGRIVRLREKHPDAVPVFIQNSDGSITAKFPVKLLSLRNPSERTVSDEQKAAASERLRIYRERRKAEKVEKMTQ